MVGQLRFLCPPCRIYLQKYGELRPTPEMTMITTATAAPAGSFPSRHSQIQVNGTDTEEEAPGAENGSEIQDSNKCKLF
ncbi:unnamed protein product [Protopolystoma xenopodis]|uniref:Uncharacterized protein n=1 Tax=Protopolystoma xenopodis TaxID=117903 RepID=A0A3S4ZBY2_9PLAT|nr:unnamed protein product [Protopolystoma xenopodis]